MIDLDAVNRGFSREAAPYDEQDRNNPIVRWARGLVRGELVRRVPAGGDILEINAGTGADAAWLAECGYRVHATDLADGMMAAIRGKIAAAGAHARFTAQQVSFLELERVEVGPFDAVFSNLGGLNCVADLAPVARGVAHVLKPDGRVIWVVMPRVCPWELALALRGQLKIATRRFARDGVIANVRGAQVRTWYFAPSQVLRALGAGFRLEALRSFSLFCPPMFMEGFPHRFPRLTRALMGLDERLGRWPALNGWGDFFILTARRTGEA